MSSFMFGLTAVMPSRADAADLSQRAGLYTTLSSAADTAMVESAAAVSDVAAANEGETTDAFLSQSRGAGSVSNHLGDLSAAARATATAYSTAAAEVTRAQAAMTSTAVAAEGPYLRALLLPPPLRQIRQAQIITATRRQLRAHDEAGGTAVAAAFSAVNLPSPYNVEYYTAVPQELEDAWNNLTDQEKRDLMQLMADRHADELGVPRVELEFYNDPKGALGVRTGDGRVRINEHFFNDPNLIGVPVHEMQHHAQYVYIDAYEDIADDPDYLDDVLAGRVPDPMEQQYGISTEEAQRLAEGNADHVREKGYWERPVEIDARFAGDRYTDGLTIQEFEELVEEIR